MQKDRRYFRLQHWQPSGCKPATAAQVHPYPPSSAQRPAIRQLKLTVVPVSHPYNRDCACACAYRRRVRESVERKTLTLGQTRSQECSGYLPKPTATMQCQHECCTGTRVRRFWGCRSSATFGVYPEIPTNGRMDCVGPVGHEFELAQSNERDECCLMRNPSHLSVLRTWSSSAVPLYRTSLQRLNYRW